MKHLIKLVANMLNRLLNLFRIEAVIIGKMRLISVLDYIRFSSLELVAFRLYEKGIQGNVAELGVYRGDFARYINKFFPDRKLYLFDTFEGFNARDMKTETKYNYSDTKSPADWSKTSIDLVLSKMKYKENVIIKKGFFPESAIGVEDKFVFVSIDTDLFDPIYQGLVFFYDKLCKGGVIMVHDYNNIIYKGAKAAVEEFSEKYNVPFFPLSDYCGSAVFLK